MRFLYLRFVIGGLCAACVAVVAALTLSVALPIALSTIDTNSVAAVTSLGSTAASVIENSFGTPLKSVVKAGGRPRASNIDTALPSESPQYNAATGAPGIDEHRRIVYTIAQSGNFKYFLVEYATVDGMTCLGFKVDVVKSYAIRCYHPNATDPTGPRVMTVSVHDMPSGQINQTLHGFIVFALRNSEASSSLADATYRQFWDGRLSGGPAGAAVWAKPVLITDPSDDFVSISVASRVRNTTAHLGVTSVFFTLEGVSTALDSARLTSNSKAFLYDADKYLVAASGGLATYVSDDFTGVDEENGCTTTQNSTFFFPSPRKRRVCRYHIMRSPHAGLTKAVEKEPALFDNAPVVGKGHLVAGQYILVQSLKTIQYGYHLDLVLITPEEDIIGAKKILPIALGVTAAAGVAVRMGKAARLEEDDADERLSMMAEIHDLQQSFVMLRDELTRIRAFVPQSLLRAQSATDTEPEDEEHHDDPAEKAGALHSLTSAPTVTSRSNSERDLTGRRRTVKEKHIKGLNIDTGIKSENVTVLVVNLRGYHAAVSHGLDPDAVAAMVDAVFHVTQQEKGVVDSFHGDRFFVTFNAARPAASHAARAAKVACRVGAVLQDTNARRRSTMKSTPGAMPKDRPGSAEQSAVLHVAPAKPYALPITAGISTGHAQVGNLGSAAIKRFSIVGPVVAQAAVLERMCKLHDGAHCLVPQRLFDDLQTAVRLRTVDFVQLPGKAVKRGQLVASIEGEIAAAADDEWMYQLEEQDTAGAKDARSTFNGIWAELVGGKVESASSTFTTAIADIDRAELNAALEDDGPRSAKTALWAGFSVAERRTRDSLSPAVVPSKLGRFFEGSINAW